MAESTPGRLLVVGELRADILVNVEGPPVFGGAEQIAPATRVTLGSSCAIAACGAATLAVDTSLVGIVGDDLLGRFVLDEVKARGVDVRHCRIDSDARTGTSTVLSLPSGDKSTLTSLGAVGRVRLDDIKEELLSTIQHIHIGSYFIQSSLHGLLADFYRDCRKRGISTSLDPDVDPRGTWSSGIRGVLRSVDVLLCDEHEARRISGETELEKAVSWLVSRLPEGGELVIKKGEHGASVYVGSGGTVGQTYDAIPQPVDRPLVDTVGAGDCFAAGYLAARMRNLPIEERLRVGVRTGTASTRAAGGVAGQLTWQEVQNPRLPKTAPVSQWQRTHP